MGLNWKKFLLGSVVGTAFILAVTGVAKTYAAACVAAEAAVVYYGVQVVVWACGIGVVIWWNKTWKNASKQDRESTAVDSPVPSNQNSLSH